MRPGVWAQQLHVQMQVQSHASDHHGCSSSTRRLPPHYHHFRLLPLALALAVHWACLHQDVWHVCGVAQGRPCKRAGHLGCDVWHGGLPLVETGLKLRREVSCA